MAQTKTGATGTKASPSAAEVQQWYEKNKQSIENFADATKAITTLRDVTRTSTKTISTINKDNLKTYISNIGSNEANLRSTARYLYYRSNVFYRLVNWYADMWDLRCRKVVPKYDLVKNGDNKKMLKSFNDTLDVLDRMNLQGNMTEVFLNVYVQDVYFGLKYLDDTGMFFFPLEPDECIIDSRYSTGDFGFSIDMSKFRNAQRQKLIEYLGSPLKEMYSEYERTNVKYVHCPDEYAVCFKFRTDSWDTVIPPFLPIFLQLAALEDLVDIQAEADALSIYKLIYIPMKVLSGTKNVNDFEISPTIIKKYYERLIDDNMIPDNVSAAMVPGDELKTIDFSKTVDSDTNSVEKASNQVLQTAGGGAVLNANNITSTAAFEAWLKAETEFAMSTLLPQVNGFCNRMLSYELSNPSKVEHFEVSVYTKDKLAEQLLESCKYSFSNRLAYNTCLGISEKDTMALEYLENQILGLPTLMNHPLTSSFTQSGTKGEVGEGAPTKDSGELSPSGERSRNS